MFMKVDLPLPLAPMMATKSPALNVHADSAQRMHLGLAKLIGLPNLANLHDRDAGASDSRIYVGRGIQECHI